MGTAGPSGFHSANTHAELLEKPVQIHRLKHVVAQTEKGRAGGGWGVGIMKERKDQNREKEPKGREIYSGQICLPQKLKAEP